LITLREIALRNSTEEGKGVRGRAAGRGQREEGRGPREAGRGKREEGRGKREEGRGKREEGRGTYWFGDFPEHRALQKKWSRYLLPSSPTPNLAVQTPSRTLKFFRERIPHQNLLGNT
jgi:hypothetical protein